MQIPVIYHAFVCTDAQHTKRTFVGCEQRFLGPNRVNKQVLGSLLRVCKTKIFNEHGWLISGCDYAQTKLDICCFNMELFSNVAHYIRMWLFSPVRALS